MEREVLEQLALESCDAELFYDLLDDLEITTDECLYELIGEPVV